MDNKQFITRLSKRMSLDYKETASLVQATINVLLDTLDVGNAIAIPGFGNFSVKKEDETIQKDLSTGKRLLLPPHLEIEFKPSNILSKRI